MNKTIRIIFCTFLILSLFVVLWSCNMNPAGKSGDDVEAIICEDPEELAAMGITADSPQMKLTFKDGALIEKSISTPGVPADYISITESATGQYLAVINLKPNLKRQYKTVLFSVYNSTDPGGWTVNIGDSSTNNGYGGDAGTQSNDSELQVYNNTLNVYASQAGGSGSIHSAANFLPMDSSRRVRYQIENNKLTYWKNSDSNPKTVVSSPYIFALNGQSDSEGPVNYTIYAGFNRTIGTTSRSGSGITTIYIYLNDPVEYSLVTAPSNYSVTLKHLKYRDGVWSWSKWKAYTGFSGYEHFLNGRNSGDWDEKESEHIFAAEIWKPAASAIKNIVFVSAGQQGALVDRQDPPNITTGQQANWHKKPDASGLEELNSWKYVQSKTVTVEWKSLVGQIMSDYYYNNAGNFEMTPQNTYLVAFFDTCFYYEMSVAKRNERVTDYLEYIMSKTNNNAYGNLENIYLAGASRGGALVTRLAYEFQQNSSWSSMVSGVNIIVSSLDGVAVYEDGELFTTSSHVDNPLDSIYGRFCFDSNLNTHVTSSSNLHIYQIAGGADVVPLIVNKHAFYLDNLGSTLKFSWVNRSHTEIGREWHDDTCVSQLRWLQDQLF